MNTQREQQWQALAERHERIGAPDAADESGVRAYRLVHRLVRSAPIPALPADFASRTAGKAAARQPRRAPPDTWLIWAVLACALFGGSVFALPVLLDSLQQLFTRAGGVPWPMLLAAALSLGLVACVDAVLDRRRLRYASRT